MPTDPTKFDELRDRLTEPRVPRTLRQPAISKLEYVAHTNMWHYQVDCWNSLCITGCAKTAEKAWAKARKVLDREQMQYVINKSYTVEKGGSING